MTKRLPNPSLRGGGGGRGNRGGGGRGNRGGGGRGSRGGGGGGSGGGGGVEEGGVEEGAGGAEEEGVRGAVEGTRYQLVKWGIYRLQLDRTIQTIEDVESKWSRGMDVEVGGSGRRGIPQL